MGSLFSALTTAVSGLSAQSSAIGNISQNLANAQTVGYKSVGTSFEELVNSSSSTVNNPGGVFATPQYQNDVQGSITSSNTPTSMAISGAGYFAVETASQSSTGVTTFTGTDLYTRQGDFTLNAAGYLVNSSSYYLLGYTNQNADGTFNTDSTSPIQVSALLGKPVPTSTVTYNANLPANAAVGYSSSQSQVQIYDAFGTPHDLDYTWVKTGTNAWDLKIDVPEGSTTGTADYTAIVPVTFNNGGAGAAGTIGSITAGGGYTVDASPSAGVGLSLSFADGAGTTQSVDLNFGTIGGSTGLTQFADTNSTVAVTSFTQNGLAQGSFNSLTITSSGLVSLNYSNGTNKTIAQIPIVQFNAQDQLQSVTGGAYSATLAAGVPRYNTAGDVGAGTISAGSLEQSNVDIAAQFTTLIQAQQVYSANAKVVTADNQLLQTTINMVQ